METLDDFLKRTTGQGPGQGRGIRQIRDSWIINIDITNFCPQKCSYCSRASRHIHTPFFASLDFVGKALNSLQEWPRGIGIIGGEPQLHPQFSAICQMLRQFKHPGGYCLFTSLDVPQAQADIFGQEHIYKTDHSRANLHHPILVSLEEAVPDPALQRELIEKCWLQRLWSPSITPKGAFWCEIAGVMDILWDGTGGYPVEPGWWKRDSYEDQIARHCGKCGVCIPMELATDKDPVELVTPRTYDRLKTIQSPYLNQCAICHEQFDRKTIESRQKNMINICYIQNREKPWPRKYF
jgi:hypothetical protein